MFSSTTTYLRAQYDQEERRLIAMDGALQYYDGKARKPLVTQEGQPDDNKTTNYAKEIVETQVGLMLGEGFRIEIGNKETEETPEEAYLNEVWPEAQRAMDLLDIEMNGAIFGHCWAKIRLEANRPTVYPIDPMCMQVKWDARDYRNVIIYRNEYTGENEDGRIITYREDVQRVGQGWEIQESSSEGDNPFSDPLVTPWPYSFAPFFECKNLPVPSEFWGHADLHPSVLSQIHYCHRLDSLINRILRLHAFPKTVGKGLKPSDIQVGVGGTLFIVNNAKEAELYNLEMQSDLTAAREKLREWLDELYDMTHTPGVVRGKIDKLGSDSSLALKILYGPAVKHVWRKRTLRTEFLTRIIRALLEIGKKDAKAKIKIYWPPIIPANEKEMAETALIKKNVGFSQDTLIKELGGNPVDEKEKRKEDSQQPGTRNPTLDGGAQ